jgi:protein SCO1/2
MLRGTSNQRGGARGVLVGLVALVGLGLGVLGGSLLLGKAGSGGQVPEDFPGTVLPAAMPLPDFSLLDDHGRVFDKARLEGKWSFVFFGYTHCPDVCPMTLNVFNQVYEGLAETADGLEDVQFVFVSVDPERDGPQHLEAYVTYFNEDFLGVTGEPDALDVLTRPLGVLHVKVAGETEQDYLVDHTASVFLIDPEGRFKALFSVPHEAPRIVEGFEALRAG